MPTLNPASMDSVAQFVLAFMDQQFSFDDAHQYFGPTSEEDDDLIEIEPAAQSPLESVELEKLEWEPGQPAILAGIMVEFKHPILFDFDKLATYFGPEEESTRLKRGPPIPYSFDLKTNVYEGYLLLEAAEYAPRNRVRKVEQLIVRRYPRLQRGEHPRSAGICVLADLAITQAHGPYFKLSSPDDLGKVIEAGRPRLEIELDNLLGGKDKKVTIRFSPVEIDSFSANGVLFCSTPLNALVAARGQLVRFSKGKVSREEVQESLTDNILIPFRTAIDQFLGSPQPNLAQLLQTLDGALSAQMELVFAHPAFKQLQSHWLGLHYLVENLTPDLGFRLEVFSVKPEASARSFQSRWLEREHFLTEEAVPLLAIVQDAVEGSEGEKGTGDLVVLAHQTQTIVLCSLATKELRSLWDKPEGRDVVVSLPRICLRPGLDVPGHAPKCFNYASTGKKPDTTVWGSGAWAFAALCAASQAKLGRIEPESVSIPLPPLVRESPDAAPAVLEPLPTSLSGSFTTLKYNKQDQTISLAKLAPLNESKKPNERLAARLIFNQLLQTIRRLRYLHVADKSPRDIVEPLRKALQTRMPDGVIAVDVKAGKLQVEVIPTFPIEGKLTSFKYEEPWPEPK